LLDPTCAWGSSTIGAERSEANVMPLPSGVHVGSFSSQESSVSRVDCPLSAFTSQRSERPCVRPRTTIESETGDQHGYDSSLHGRSSRRSTLPELASTT